MQDNLEDFIEQHRSELDIYEPPDRVWEGISKQLPRPKKKRLLPYYLAAACVSFIICGAIGYFAIRNATKATLPANANTEVVVLKPEINEAESYYTAVVTTGLNELGRYSTGYPELYQSFKTEIDTLGKMYAQLKVEYNNSQGNEAVLQAMVDNLQKQVSLLKMQMEVIRRIKHGEQNTTNKKTKFT